MSFFNTIGSLFRRKFVSNETTDEGGSRKEESPVEEFQKREEARRRNPLYAGGRNGDYLFENADEFKTDEERDAALSKIIPRRPVTSFIPASPADIFRNPSAEAATVEGGGAIAMDGGGMGKNGILQYYGVKSSVAASQDAAPVPLSPEAQAMAVHRGGVSNGPIGFGFDPIKKYGINDRVLRHYQNRCFITWNSCAIIAGHELVAPACSVPAEDAIAHGYNVVCVSSKHDKGEEHESSEVEWLKEIRKACDGMCMTDLCIKLVTKKRIFGVIMAIPVMVPTDDFGNELKGEKFDYSEEYDPKKITKNSYKGFAIVEPQWLTYEFDEESSMDPTSLHFYEPTYIVKPDGTRIHRSWVIRLINKEVPDILKPTYYFGGLSLTQMIYERMWCADKIANEAPLLAMTKRLLIADGNMEQLIAEPQKANMFFKALNYFRDNWSIFVKKPNANVQQIDTSLADLTPVTMSQYQLVAAIAGIPVTKLMKNVPTGLQSTGDYEKDDYDQLHIFTTDRHLASSVFAHHFLKSFLCFRKHYLPSRELPNAKAFGLRASLTRPTPTPPRVSA